MNVEDTVRIAHEAGLPHWKYNGVNQVLTTDFAVSSTNPEMKLFAIQAKPAEELEKAGTIKRLELERHYLGISSRKKTSLKPFCKSATLCP